MKVYVTPDANGLPPGHYDSEVLFRNMTSGYIQTRYGTLEVLPIPGEIEVTDSIPPPNDYNMPFGDVFVSLSMTEKITIANTDPNYNLIVTDISLGGQSATTTDTGELSIKLPATKGGPSNPSPSYLPTGWVAPERPASELIVGSGYRVLTDGIDVLLLASGRDPTILRTGLSAFPDINTVDYFDCSSAAPTEEDLAPYDAVVVMSNVGFFDATQTGNVLADYVDAGAKVVQAVATFAYGGGWELAGRFATEEGYEPFVHGGAEFLPHSLGAFDPEHPIMDGVTALTDGFPVGVALEPEAEWVADWDNGTPLVATQGESVVGINIFAFDSGDFTGDVPLLFHNAIFWLLGAEGFELRGLPSLPTTIEPLDSITFDVVFEPTKAKKYKASVVINSKDKDEPEVEVQLSGTGVPEYLEITPEEDFEFSGHPGGPFLPSNTSYQLTNNGPVNVDWIAYPSVPWLDVEPTNGTLKPGASASVTIAPNAQAETLPEDYYPGGLIVTDITTTVELKRRVCLNVYTEPKIWTSPYSFDVTVTQGANTVEKLTISNGGDAGLTFSLSSREISYLPAAKTTVAQVKISEDKMVLEYEFNKPIIYEGDEYDRVTIDGLEQYLRVGAPIVPVRPVKVLVPFGKKVLTTRTIPLETYDLTGSYWLAPAQEPYPLSYQGVVKPTAPDPAIYGQAAQWPGVYHEQVTAQSKRGYQLLIVNLFPLQYVPATGKISYTTKLRLEIDLADALTSGVLRPSDVVETKLVATVDNPSVLEGCPETKTSIEKLDGAVPLPSGGPYQYVIITNEALEAAPGPWNFQVLCDAKIARGMTATIVTTEWVYANYDGTRPDGGTDNQTRIRNFLIDAYQSWGTEYVLLGGTNSIVPARMFYVDGETMPVDMYYGCVDPPECTFDYDQDGLYGEPYYGVGGGDVDLYAEIYVGRAAVENATELENFIKKTLTYGITENEYLPRIAMLGEYLGFGGVSEYAKDSKEQIRLGGDYDGYFTYGFENHTQSSFIDFITEGCLSEDPGCCWPLYDKDATWYPDDLICLMNGGVHVFNYLGHANYTYDMKLYTSDLAQLTNTDYFFVYSQGCMSGGFDMLNCFAEVITSMEHGAFAVVMNARSGWGRFDSTDGPSHRFDRQFWDAVVCEDMLEMGRANQDSKEDNLWDINGDLIRWCYYELNLFGDPAQKFRFAAESCDWIELVPDAGTVAPGDVIDVNVIFISADKYGGTYQGEITISSNDPYDPQITIPVTMTVKPIDYFTELFEPDDPTDPNDPNCNDMANRTLTFRPSSSCSYYRSCINEAADFPVVPTDGTIVSLRDDDYIRVDLDDAYINFYGRSYPSFYIGSNGYITFLSGDIRYFETLADHFDLPRIAALFDDLDPSAGGTVSWKQLDDRVVVTFENVPEYSLSNSNSFQIEMYFDGKLRITFLDIAAPDGLVGLSEGNGLPPYFTQTNLSEYNLCTFMCDLNDDLDVDLTDFAIFAAYWQNQYDSGATQTVRDEFNTISYGGNDGTQNWSNDWQEIGEADGPTSGKVRLVSATESNALRLGRIAKNRGASREVDLSGATFATLTFNWRRGGLYYGNDATVDISSDGGSTWSMLLSIPDGHDKNPQSESFDISAYIASNTQLRFIANDQGIGYLYFDNIQIEYGGGEVPWYHECDFNQDFRIDINDLRIFCEHWLE